MNPITAHQVAGALQGLSGDMGAFAGYEAQKEMATQQAALEERKEAANRAFQAALYNARAAQDQSQFEQTKAMQQKELDANMDYRNRSLEEQSSYHQDALSQQAADRAATREIERQRLGIEQQNANSTAKRADAVTHKEKTDKQSGVIGTRLTAVGRLITTYQRQRDAELASRMKAISGDMNLLADPKAQQAAQAKAEREVDAKYGPLIEKRQAEYDRLNAKFGELAGVDMGDAEEAATVGDVVNDQYSGTPGSSTPSAPSDDDGDAGLPSAADAGLPSNPELPPVPNAKRAPDGNWYVPDPKRPGGWMRVDQ